LQDNQYLTKQLPSCYHRDKDIARHFIFSLC
jgi:hypothetical protein